MKHDVFNQYVDSVVQLFKIEKSDLFSKSKKRKIVDARHLLYYLCDKRPMRLTYIKQYMLENGYHIDNSSIIHGINMVNKKIQEDNDYVTVIKSIN